LKNDTEENWKKTVLESDGGTKKTGESFKPLNGELIIFSEDNQPPKIKIGDGIKNVLALPYIAAGDLSGDEAFVLRYNSYSNFPVLGDTNKLYIDLTDNTIYYYIEQIGYRKLYSFTVSRKTI